ncbi:hypothetical protein L0Y65_04550 [Candidatus Micrarchaeota archaeon]|nr:hypothetical protein [Candidatus Micrarchaeota archaeon]
MTPSTKPPRTLRSRGMASHATAEEGPRAVSAFAKCPESSRILEEMIFNDRFREEYAGRTHLVGVNEVTAIKSSNPLPCVGTISLTSCVGIAAYDPYNCVGSVGHIKLASATPDLEHVARMLYRVIEAANLIGGKTFVLYSFNGRTGGRVWNDALASFLEKEADALISAGVVSRFEQREEHHFVLDTRNGYIFTAKPG